ncbi:M67 family metallopeptidase [Pseudomonas lalucatii]|uniref:M67 family metallopeptidase n=1 Tax=Pseudomonas lalucatii TaxID=1424203 RepID=A0ABS5Q2C7_9PSED|nr:M67 family metallopeptidase [Pseudomonas lalucatii]MBS7662925.1 M67 family metallopeptidase [Pseudomonas lalucatii]MBS7724726.1 M67 family metallopeptidase [Pseudomonas lalucatii]QVM87290.1 M67 family metallopeptidase [Pseudomonas lalucatii]
MLIILSELLDAMLAMAREDHPLETCGVIVAPVGSPLPTRLIPMRNAAQSQSFFQFDPQEQLRVWREMECRNEEPRVIYHSHTHSAGYPSRDDIRLAGEPQAHYVILCTAQNCGPPVRSFRIVNGQVTEEGIQAVAQYPAAVVSR